MESALGIDLHVHFEFFRELVADDEAREPAVRSLVDELITEFVVHINRAEFLRKFEGQEEGLTRGRDSPADRVVGVVEEQLRENRNRKAGFSRIVKPPFDAGIGLTQAEFSF